jgi:hypothetical protein
MRPELRIAIETRIIELSSTADPKLQWSRERATRHQALPLYGDKGGWVLLRPSGELIQVPLDEDFGQIAEPVKELLLQTVALVAGAQKYPELRELIPVRPADAVECAQCNGTGRMPSFPTVYCGKCGALGWRRLL